MGRCPSILTQFAYTPEAWVALARNPEDRGEAVRRLMEHVGGRLVAFYNSFGEYDGLFIYEAPDEVTAAAAEVAGISAGHVKAVKTTTLLSAEHGMEAMHRAGAATRYQRPEGM
jgi:uncharacterized protein with GYD domain